MSINWFRELINSFSLLLTEICDKTDELSQKEQNLIPGLCVSFPFQQTKPPNTNTNKIQNKKQTKTQNKQQNKVYCVHDLTI